MVEIHLYGKLRHHLDGARSKNGSVLTLEPEPGETLASLLVNTGIPVDEINHIFFNSRLLASRNKAASFMGFRQATANLSDWDLDVPVDDGDRVGLFGMDVALLGM